MLKLILKCRNNNFSNPMTSYTSFNKTIFFDKNENDSKTYDPNGVGINLDDFVKHLNPSDSEAQSEQLIPK